MRQHRDQNRVLLGAVIIVFGVLALLDNLHIFNVANIFAFWPTIIILVGVLKLYQTQNRAGYVVGAALTAFGIVLTLDHIGLIYFRARDWWPLLLIGAGLLVVSRGWLEKEMGWGVRGNNNVLGPAGDAGAATASVYLNVTAVMSGNKLRNDVQDFRGGEITAVMGGVEIDLRQASMLTEATVNVFSVWGGIVIKVPADWSVISNVVPILGGVDDRSVPPAASGKRLIVDGYVVMGGVEIKN